MNKINIPTYKWVIICVSLSVLSFIVGFYQGEKIYLWVITPFNDTSGKFDYSILWTAIGGIGTIFLSGVTIWQTWRSNIREIIDKNTVKIIANSNYCSYSFSKIKNSLEYKPQNIANEILVCKKNTKTNILSMCFEYKAFNDCIPDEYYIKNPRLLYNNTAGSTLSSSITISNKAIIVNKNNPFMINIKIVDDNVDLSNNEFWFYYDLTVIKKCEIGSVACSYDCLNVFSMNQDIDNPLFYNAEINNVITHQKGKVSIL